MSLPDEILILGIYFFLPEWVDRVGGFNWYIADPDTT